VYSENIFIWTNSLQFDWFQLQIGSFHRLRAMMETKESRCQSLYQGGEKFQMENFGRSRCYYDRATTSNILGYRMSVSRAVSALVAGGQKAKAFELLELAAKDSAEKYNSHSLPAPWLPDILLQGRAEGASAGRKSQKEYLKNTIIIKVLLLHLKRQPKDRWVQADGDSHWWFLLLLEGYNLGKMKKHIRIF
jgi:hypothetical protein